MISRFQTNVGRRPLLFEILLRYTTNAAVVPPSQNNFLVDYLINSLGLSKDEALSATQKVTLRKSFRNDPDLVVNFLQNLGLNKIQVRTIISAHPKLLTSNVEKTLQPKVQLLQDLGMSRSDLSVFLMGCKSFLTRGLNSEIRPSVQYLRNLLGSDANTVRALKKCGFLVQSSSAKLITANVELLQKTGLSAQDISRMIVNKPLKVLQKPEGLEKVLYELENDFGIPRYSKMFYHGIVVLSICGKSTLDKKFRVLRTFGWSDATICSVFRKYPYIVCTSEHKLRKVWNFFTVELGHRNDYLATYPAFFNLSFEKRVKPRSDILKILNENNLNHRKNGLASLLNIPESKFINKFLLPYKKEIPDLFNSYLRSQRSEA